MDIRCGNDRCRKSIETKEDAISVFDTDKCVACNKAVEFTLQQIAAAEEFEKGITPIIIWMARNSLCDKCSRCGVWEYDTELSHTLCEPCYDDQIGR